MSAIARPTPMRALASGNHATAIERNVTMSTNSAMRMPTASVIDSAGTDVENRSPPIATCDPAGMASRTSAAMPSRAVLVSAGTSVA